MGNIGQSDVKPRNTSSKSSSWVLFQDMSIKIKTRNVTPLMSRLESALTTDTITITMIITITASNRKVLNSNIQNQEIWWTYQTDVSARVSNNIWDERNLDGHSTYLESRCSFLDLFLFCIISYHRELCCIVFRYCNKKQHR